ncbi:hypothetical protein [Sagittula sp. MA-2]|jgi:hypothetical protein|uniref:hypothetical protein n=1 Tax=Sagittula sp. MA-2 TaxID=3048007 RepID=UPI0024C32182|nr:hypothetical protein [Sagittula sp. MA-2]WHZ33401.1 hypothetical protein QNI11_12125 [Sagittula sp. MA-2]
MTTDEFPHTIRGRIIELSKVLSAFAVILSAGGVIWGWFGPISEFFDRLDQLVEDVAQLQEDVARANGDDRVIRQPAGLSYIREPVRQGDPVVMILVASRTKLGASCRLTDWVPIFTDEQNIPTPGRRARSGPIARQIDRDLQTLRIEMVPPDELRPGRVSVYLTLTYSCPSPDGPAVVQDRTDALPYLLIERNDR